MVARKKEYDVAQETTKGREQAYSALDASRVAALVGGGKASTSGQFETIRAVPQLSDSAVKDVAKAVVTIVDTTNNMSLGNELCITLLGQSPNITPAAGSALEACKTRLDLSTPQVALDQPLMLVMPGYKLELKPEDLRNLEELSK